MIAILVPVLGRPEQIDPLLVSIAEATTNPHRVLLICSPQDSALDVCMASDADMIVVPWKPDRADFARKINLAYRETDEPWLFQAATDLRFHRHWDAMALRAAGTARVIGTNDLGNPLVQRGHHSTHTMFACSYIEERGGTFDDSGAVFSEAYDHQFTDSECIETAKLRGEFSFARQAIVEHLHPHWKKGAMDATYEKALRCTDKDRALYLGRMRLVKRAAARREL